MERVEEYIILRKFWTLLIRMWTLSIKTCNSIIFCLQKPRNVIVIAQNILQTYKRCCADSLCVVVFICWYRSQRVKSKNLLNDVEDGKSVWESCVRDECGQRQDKMRLVIGTF